MVFHRRPVFAVRSPRMLPGLGVSSYYLICELTKIPGADLFGSHLAIGCLLPSLTDIFKDCLDSVLGNRGGPRPERFHQDRPEESVAVDKEALIVERNGRMNTC